MIVFSQDTVRISITEYKVTDKLGNVTAGVGNDG